tara:strand:- start:931 stop:1194 length:264 start_codon:yes stop_codon:yes gene_type:complete
LLGIFETILNPADDLYIRSVVDTIFDLFDPIHTSRMISTIEKVGDILHGKAHVLAYQIGSDLAWCAEYLLSGSTPHGLWMNEERTAG